MTRRILIAGGPRTGKTTLAERLAGESPIHATDKLIGAFGWSEASAEVSRWFDMPGPFVIEGVAVPRAIRKWLARHPTGAPADLIYYSDTAKVLQTPGQKTMHKGVQTVWREIFPSLALRGVTIKAF